MWRSMTFDEFHLEDLIIKAHNRACNERTRIFEEFLNYVVEERCPYKDEVPLVVFMDQTALINFVEQINATSESFCSAMEDLERWGLIESNEQGGIVLTEAGTRRICRDEETPPNDL